MRILKRAGKRLATVPVLGRALLLPYRLGIALGYAGAPAQQLFAWLLRSREHTNFTYPLTPLSRRYLAAFVANVAAIPLARSEAYLQELEGDAALRAGIATMMATSPRRAFCDPVAEYGRRLGWYGIVRATKPRVIVETGVEKGLGACVFTAALRRNAAEGHPGRYYGTDIDPEAGFLLPSELRAFGEFIIGDSLATLKTFPAPIDLFIHDSDHAEAYEAAEYAAVEGKLSPQAIVLSDNARVTGALLAWAERTGRPFHFYAEFPARHWYPGAGIGAALPPGDRAASD